MAVYTYSPHHAEEKKEVGTGRKISNKKILSHTIIWMNLENTVLSEVSNPQEGKYL